MARQGTQAARRRRGHPGAGARVGVGFELAAGFAALAFLSALVVIRPPRPGPDPVEPVPVAVTDHQETVLS